MVNTTTSNDQAWPKVSGLTNSDFVVAWESYGGQDGDDAGVFARIFERDGTPVTGEFQVNTYTTSAQIEPAIIFLMDNGFIISWTSWYQDGSSGGVYAQIYEEDGVPRGSEFRVNTTTDNEQSWSDIVLLPDDEFAVCWQSYNQDGNANGVYLQLYNNDGSMRGTELKVNDYTTNNQHMPGISTLNNESLILAWSSFGQDGNDDGVYAKYYLNQVVDPLQAFSLLAPADESLLEYAKVDFLWNSANILPVNFPWEVVYDLYLDLNSGFTNPAIYPAIVDTFYTVDVFLPDMDYYWRVVAKNIDGDSLFSSETYTFHIDEDPSTIVTANPEIPQVFELYGNFPNPFNPSTTIKYALPPDKASYNVKLKIFDALGELVMVLKDEQQGSGIHQVTWNGNNSAGNTVPSGVYFCVVEAGHYRASHKMLMIK
ncbi:MAG: T9SS type A sorting domain-containing protein [Calditrichaceae bacterium]|nr:T9SS type A sorting domain-containing protein [Calditrichaceae bacterium]RQV95800.1 MAG: T9SS C-terminal target domain-containing protein [Calditrichota bacterium]